MPRYRSETSARSLDAAIQPHRVQEAAQEVRPCRIIQVGVGGYGSTWLETVSHVPTRAQYAALVDTDPAALEAARRRTSVPEARCFSRLSEALAGVDADAVLCVVPPAFHEQIVIPALDAGLHVLTEKPIADTIEASRIVERAARSGRTLMVAQKGRFHPWVRRFRQVVESGEIGQLSHVTLHYRAPFFRWGESGFRHRMADPLLVEMSIHHFDLLRALLGQDPVEVSGFSWNAPWSGYAGDVAASLRFTMANGLPVIYEAYCRSSGDLTSWYGDIRAEGETGVATFVYPDLALARRGASQTWVTAPREHLLRAGDPQDGQAIAFGEFLDALAEGRRPESAGEENLVSVAMVFAAAAACRGGTSQRIDNYLRVRN